MSVEDVTLLLLGLVHLDQILNRVVVLDLLQLLFQDGLPVVGDLVEFFQAGLDCEHWRLLVNILVALIFRNHLL